jgi:hypothetical protein
MGKERIKNMMYGRETFSPLRKYSCRNKCYRMEDEGPIKDEVQGRKCSGIK